MHMSKPKAYAGRVVFDHLPKTGGSAIASWLTRELGNGCISPHIDGEHRDLIRQFGGQYSVLCGHVSFAPNDAHDPRYSYVTLFREPLDRSLSWLYFVLTNHDDHARRALVPAVRRFLDSDGADLDDILRPHLCNPYVEHFCRLGGDGRHDDATRLAQALAALEQYAVIGLHDRMPRFIDDLSALLGLHGTQALERINVTASRPRVDGIPAPLRERLTAMNQLDLRLYRSVQDLAPRTVTPITPAVPPQPYTLADPYRRETGDLRFGPVALREGSEVESGTAVHLDLELWAARRIPRLLLGLHIKDSTGRLAYGVHSGMLQRLTQGLNAGLHHLSFGLRLALPVGRYTAGLAVVEQLDDGTQHDLAWHEQLCAFEVCLPHNAAFIGYADQSAQLVVEHPLQDSVIAEAPGALRTRSAPAGMRCRQRYRIDVALRQNSAQTWRRGGPRPVLLSYHWLDAQGNVRVFDGLRTALPAGGLPPGVVLDWHAEVEAPHEPGTYTLVLTMLQESVAWFEHLGFDPARLTIQVTP